MALITSWPFASPAAIVLFAALSGCGSEDAAPAGAPAVETQSERLFLYEREFAVDGALAARWHQVVVLDLAPATNGLRSIEHVVRHQLDEGDYTFCIAANDRFLAGMTLEDSDGNALGKVDRSSHCIAMTLATGTYRMRILHDASSIAPSSRRVAFVRATSGRAPLVDANGKALGGWWAMQADPSIDPSGQRRASRTTMRNWAGNQFAMVADFASTSFDGSSLFNLSDPSHALVYWTGNTPVGANLAGRPDSFLVFTDPAQSLAFKTMTVTDLGGYRALLGTPDVIPGGSDFFAFDVVLPGGPTVTAFWGDKLAGTAPIAAPKPFQVAFRYYPDGTQIGALNEGEVALYQQCNYQGRAAVFAVDTPNLGELTSPVTTLDKTAASVRLGNNTSVLLNSGPVYTGVRQVIKADTPCLPTPTTTTSILIRPLTSVITLSSLDCERCKLRGVELNARDLSSVDFDRADLTGATLNGSDLTGATLQQALLVGVDLGNAHLDGAVLDNANLQAANLANASLTNGASLQGAHLKNANLSQAQLNGADFSFANFYGDKDAATGGSCPIDTSKCPGTKTGFTCACASAAGATMDGTKFINAYLYGVDFSGSTPLTNVNFNSAIVISAVFAGRTITADDDSSATSGFALSYLQGALLAGTNLAKITLKDAWVDFTSGGSDLSIVLSEAHTQFAGSTISGPVCVNPFYGNATTVPSPTPGTVICPNGTRNSGGCGLPASDGSNPNWMSSADIGRWTTPGWYDTPPSPTYPPPTPPPQVCNGLPVNANW